MRLLDCSWGKYDRDGKARRGWSLVIWNRGMADARRNQSSRLVDGRGNENAHARIREGDIDGTEHRGNSDGH